jgi:glycerol-3-phosphate dehydrogenase (NAD(P)+)
MSRISVLGDGAWGTALATLARDCGHEVAVWSRRRPGSGALREAEAVIISVPAQVVGALLPTLDLTPEDAIIITAKGIDRATLRFMHEVARQACPRNPILILSGPSFAEDVSKRLPTAVTMAAETLATDDLMGVALGGSVKNVLAIACGISDGMQLGASARAALIARGFSELSRLGRHLGARPETLMGLSGLGDLLLTCSSPQSRNYAFGRRLGEGQSVAQAVAAASGVVEGVHSAQAALALSRRDGISMPITEAVSAIIERGANPDDVLKGLLARPVVAEFL